MKKSVLVYLAFFVQAVFSQAPTIQWQNTIGGNLGDVILNIDQTLDGGYIVSGRSNSNIGRDKTVPSFGIFHFWIVKIDTVGAIQWQKSFGGSLYNDGVIIKQNLDGSYIVAGTSNSNISGNKTVDTHGGDDIWVLKLDTSGTVLWQKSIGGSSLDQLSDFTILPNGNILMGATSISPISGDKSEPNFGVEDYWVLELDANGIILWQKTIGGSDNDVLASFIKTPDNGYIISGYSYSPISGNKTEATLGVTDLWVVKLDENKNIEWQKSFGGNLNENDGTACVTTDNNYIITGSSNSPISGNKTEDSKGEFDYWILKLNTLGEIIWQKVIGGASNDKVEYIDKTFSGDYILLGNSSSEISGDKTEINRGVDDLWIVKINEDGTILWDKTLGGNDQDSTTGTTIKHTSDNGIIIGSSSKSPISGDKTEYASSYDYWIIKLSPDNLSNNHLNSFYQSYIYPNPTNGIVHINFNSFQEKVTATIYNIFGQKIKSEIVTNSNEITLNLDVKSGVYFIEIENQDNLKANFKIIKN